jgi:hypothetical protein
MDLESLAGDGTPFGSPSRDLRLSVADSITKIDNFNQNGNPENGAAKKLSSAITDLKSWSPDTTLAKIKEMNPNLMPAIKSEIEKHGSLAKAMDEAMKLADERVQLKREKDAATITPERMERLKALGNLSDVQAVLSNIRSLQRMTDVDSSLKSVSSALCYFTVEYLAGRTVGDLRTSMDYGEYYINAFLTGKLVQDFHHAHEAPFFGRSGYKRGIGYYSEKMAKSEYGF